jgi:DnaJ-class molecular chaperone
VHIYDIYQKQAHTHTHTHTHKHEKQLFLQHKIIHIKKKMTDYYKILNLRRDAGLDEIRNAYRVLSMSWNPVKNNNSEDAGIMFRNVAEAYDVLSTPEYRGIYDLRGLRGLNEENYSLSRTPEKIFAKFFGTSNPFAQVTFSSTFVDEETKRQNDVLSVRTGEKGVTLDCTLEELYCGAKKLVNVTTNSLAGEHEEKTILVDVKQGSTHGSTFLYKSIGNHDNGKEPGDVKFTINQLSHDLYEVSGSNLHYKATITLAEAMGNCTIDIPTLDGRGVCVEYGEVIAPNDIKVVSGEGMPNGNGGYGDLIIRFEVVFPKHLDLDQKETIQHVLNGNPCKFRWGQKSSKK